MQEFESLGSGQFEIGTSEHFSGTIALPKPAPRKTVADFQFAWA
jgi:hypothetical protein